MSAPRRLAPAVDPWEGAPLGATPITDPAPTPTPRTAGPVATGWQRRYVAAMTGRRLRRIWRAPHNLRIGDAVALLVATNADWRPLFCGGRAWGRRGRATRAWLNQEEGADSWATLTD